MSAGKPGPRAKRAWSELRAFALSLPGAFEDHPWGESVAKVNKKVFAFLGREGGDSIGFSAKLPASGDAVLNLPFAAPTGYGLGKGGWVSVSLRDADLPPLDVMRGWIAESYRAIAPRKLVAAMDGGASPKPAPAKKARAQKARPPRRR